MVVHVIVDHQAVVLTPVNSTVLDDADQRRLNLGGVFAHGLARHGHIQLAFLNQGSRHNEVNQQKETYVDKGRNIQLGIFILDCL